MVLIKHDCVKEMTQKVYDSLIDLIAISAIACPCGHVGFHFHGVYDRKVKLTYIVITLIVSRIRCPECGKTHALLPYELIPWSGIPRDTMIEIIKTKNSREIRDVLDKNPKLNEEDIKNAKDKFRKYWKERIRSYEIVYDSNLTDRCLDCFKRQFMQNHCGNILRYTIPTQPSLDGSDFSL